MFYSNLVVYFFGFPACRTSDRMQQQQPARSGLLLQHERERSGSGFVRIEENPAARGSAWLLTPVAVGFPWDNRRWPTWAAYVGQCTSRENVDLEHVMMKLAGV